MLTEQETTDMHNMLNQMENRRDPIDIARLGNLATTTGDEWEALVRKYLDDFLNPLGLVFGDAVGAPDGN